MHSIFTHCKYKQRGLGKTCCDTCTRTGAFGKAIKATSAYYNILLFYSVHVYFNTYFPVDNDFRDMCTLHFIDIMCYMYVIAYIPVLNVEAPVLINLLFVPRFFSSRCLKEGSVEDKSPVESPFDLFNDNDFFHRKKQN